MFVKERHLAKKYLTVISENQFVFIVTGTKDKGPGHCVMGCCTEDVQLIGDKESRRFVKQKINHFQFFLSNSANHEVETKRFE